MAAHLAAVAGANTEFLNAFQAHGSVAARGQFPRLVIPRNDSSIPTVNMFIDGDSEDLMYAASIIGACADQTTYALRCTSGPRYYSEACNPTAPIITVTGGPGTYRVYSATTTRTMDYDVSATMQESCELRGTTAAVCSATIGGSVDGTTTSESITTTLSGTDYYRYDVAITGGADKTANPTAECPAPSPAPGQSGASTKAVAMWGMVGAAGVTSLLGLW